MRLCRFDNNRLGIVEGGEVLDVTKALSVIPEQRWPIAQGDPLIANLKRVIAAAKKLAPKAKKRPIAKVRLLSPVPNPSKIIGAPINYDDHIAESIKDPGIAQGRTNIQRGIGEWGLFLKANSSLIGFGEQIRLRWPDRRNDHEVELALVIGRRGSRIPKEKALEYVCAYSIGLDMTVRGPELQCFRKSIDTYSVLGPWLVTADEIADPNNLDLSIRVNGEVKQDSNTKYLVYNVERLIEFGSAMYTLHPGDVIMTGTPAGVSPVKPGDTLHAYVQGVGEGDIRIAPAYS
ncbi:MAG: fumarylacetoacetate hydrolase family protein [Betaproteobacteria bacterium]|nr:MAG: fumarylacetoacetate hydrolase family protein [Betaproteobacteria bacterium]TMG78091.1 MAG: fumarylacetoacetate hydrolase family protein [Betaproteobacteria bacterium]